MNSFTNDLNFSRIAKLWSLLFVLGLYSNLNAQTLPVAQAQNINVYVDASGNASIVPADVDNAVSGNNIDFVYILFSLYFDVLLYCFQVYINCASISVLLCLFVLLLNTSLLT